MKNKIIVILIIIIIFLVAFIVYDKCFSNASASNTEKEESVTLVSTIKLDYVTMHLFSNGDAYLEVLDADSIDELDTNSYLKERLTTLYERAFYYDIYIDNVKLKGFKLNIDDDVIKIEKIEIDNYIYIILLKSSNTIALFNYDEYYNLLYTTVYDNYNDYKNVSDVEGTTLIYTNGEKEDIEI